MSHPHLITNLVLNHIFHLVHSLLLKIPFNLGFSPSSFLIIIIFLGFVTFILSQVNVLISNCFLIVIAPFYYGTCLVLVHVVSGIVYTWPLVGVPTWYVCTTIIHTIPYNCYSITYYLIQLIGNAASTFDIKPLVGGTVLFVSVLYSHLVPSRERMFVLVHFYVLSLLRTNTLGQTTFYVPPITWRMLPYIHQMYRVWLASSLQRELERVSCHQSEWQAQKTKNGRY